MTTVRRRGKGGGGVESENEFKISNLGEPKQALVKKSATEAEWSKTINGGEAAKGTLTLESTSNTEKGKITLEKELVYEEKEGNGRLLMGVITQKGQLVIQGAQQPPQAKAANVLHGANLLASNGNNNTSTGATAVGGEGGGQIFSGGTGGEPTAATVSGAGGNGGAIKFQAGEGGTAQLEGTVKNTGGNGGEWKAAAGAGGGVHGHGTGTQKAGTGGQVVIKSGPGGSANAAASGPCTGGAGGKVQIAGGNGATGENKGGAGAGGSIELIGGNPGSAVPEGTNGGGGSITLQAGLGAEGTEGGSILLRTGKAVTATAVTVKETGATEFAKGIGVFGHAAPGAQHAELAIPGTFKKGAQGFETEAEAEAIRNKLATVIEILKEYGLTA